MRQFTLSPQFQNLRLEQRKIKLYMFIYLISYQTPMLAFPAGLLWTWSWAVQCAQERYNLRPVSQEGFWHHGWCRAQEQLEEVSKKPLHTTNIELYVHQSAETSLYTNVWLLS